MDFETEIPIPKPNMFLVNRFRIFGWDKPLSPRILVPGHVGAYVGPMLGHKNSKHKKTSVGSLCLVILGCWAILGLSGPFWGHLEGSVEPLWG